MSKNMFFRHLFSFKVFIHPKEPIFCLTNKHTWPLNQQPPVAKHRPNTHINTHTHTQLAQAFCTRANLQPIVILQMLQTFYTICVQWQSSSYRPVNYKWHLIMVSLNNTVCRSDWYPFYLYLVVLTLLMKIQYKNVILLYLLEVSTSKERFPCIIDIDLKETKKRYKKIYFILIKKENIIV